MGFTSHTETPLPAETPHSPPPEAIYQQSARYCAIHARMLTFVLFILNVIRTNVEIVNMDEAWVGYVSAEVLADG